MDNKLKPINQLGDSELIIAGRIGDIDRIGIIFNELIEINKYSIEEIRNIFSHHSNRLGKTVLHEAAQNCHENCIRYLIENIKINPDCLKQGDWTPIML